MQHIIIGSGIVGACTAYYLSQKKENEVVLIDGELEGKATSAGAGIICPWVDDNENVKKFNLMNKGAEYYPSLINSLEKIGEDDTGYKKTGALVTNENLESLYILKEKLKYLSKSFSMIGDLEMFKAPTAKFYFPPIDESLHTLYISGGARLDGKLLNKSLINGFKKNGGTYIQSEATLHNTNGVVKVKTQNEYMVADKVIVAAGAWTKSILQDIDVNINIHPQRGQIAHIKTNDSSSSWPVILPQNSSHYIVAFDDNRIAFGATREKETNFDYRITAGGVYEILKQGLNVVPDLQENTLSDIRIGFRPMSNDDKPLLGRIPNIKNLIVATGLGKSGLSMGPYIGYLTAKMALNKKVEVDLEPYNPLR